MKILTYLSKWLLKYYLKTCGKQLSKCLERDVWPYMYMFENKKDGKIMDSTFPSRRKQK